MLSLFSNFDDDFFRQFNRLRREMDDVFGNWGTLAPSIRSLPGTGFPAINITSSPDFVDVYVFAAGIDPKKVDVSLQRNLLTISGERHEDRSDDARVSLNERFEGSFSRAIPLPEDIDSGKVDARYKDGLLHVRVHRREGAKPKRIEVK